MEMEAANLKNAAGKAEATELEGQNQGVDLGEESKKVTVRAPDGEIRKVSPQFVPLFE